MTATVIITGAGAVPTNPVPGPAAGDGSGAPALEEMSDGQLLGHFVARQDSAVFAMLVARHWPRLLNVCRRVLGDTHGAEDACQGTFLVLFRRAHSITRPEALAG